MGTSIFKNGMVQSSDFTNFIVNPLDLNYYIEPDESVWVRLVHHNNPPNYLFASTNTFTSSVYIDGNRWFNVALCNKVGISKWELMIKQKALSTDSESKFRWIQNYNPMTATYAQVASANVTKVTTSGYTNFSSGGLYLKNGNTYLCTNNGTEGNWWGAVGSWAIHQSGIPAWNGVVVTTGYMDLYLRIDNDPKNSLSIFNNSVIANDFIEI